MISKQLEPQTPISITTIQKRKKNLYKTKILNPDLPCGFCNPFPNFPQCFTSKEMKHRMSKSISNMERTDHLSNEVCWKRKVMCQRVTPGRTL